MLVAGGGRGPRNAPAEAPKSEKRRWQRTKCLWGEARPLRACVAAPRQQRVQATKKGGQNHCFPTAIV
jgi:hypothetical protein